MTSWLEFAGALMFLAGMFLVGVAGFWPFEPPRCVCHTGKKCAYCLMREGEI